MATKTTARQATIEPDTDLAQWIGIRVQVSRTFPETSLPKVHVGVLNDLLHSTRGDHAIGQMRVEATDTHREHTTALWLPYGTTLTAL
jgi:hypothetical protein